MKPTKFPIAADFHLDARVISAAWAFLAEQEICAVEDILKLCLVDDPAMMAEARDKAIKHFSKPSFAEQVSDFYNAQSKLQSIKLDGDV